MSNEREPIDRSTDRRTCFERARSVQYRSMTDAYKPIADYGVIGNLETCALVGRDGSIDWCPLPTLESSSLFAAILDSEAGGFFSIMPAEPYEATQRYADRTNVLQTTFETDSGTIRVTDFMPILIEGRSCVVQRNREMTSDSAPE